jgi:hypothetical protein
MATLAWVALLATAARRLAGVGQPRPTAEPDASRTLETVEAILALDPLLSGHPALPGHLALLGLLHPLPRLLPPARSCNV